MVCFRSANIFKNIFIILRILYTHFIKEKGVKGFI